MQAGGETLLARAPPATNRLLALCIEEVPIDTSREALDRDLKSLFERDATLKGDSIAVVLHFLVPQKPQATLCNRLYPYLNTTERVIGKLRQAWFGLPYRIDAKFYGITPLYEDPRGIHVE